MKHLIHIPKNAGMQIRHHGNPKNNRRFTLSTSDTLISPQYHQQFVQTMKKENEALGTEHARWRDLNKTTQEKQCFALVRNPWSRVVSRYTFLIHQLDKPVASIHKQKQYSRCTFDEFLETRHKDGNKPFFWHRAIRCWYSAMNHICDEQGKVQCDILRTEFLDTEGPKFLQVEPFPRRRNVSNTAGKDYKKFYNDKTIQIIADWYKDDIDYFGFDFDTAATRNTYYK